MNSVCVYVCVCVSVYVWNLKVWGDQGFEGVVEVIVTC